MKLSRLFRLFALALLLTLAISYSLNASAPAKIQLVVVLVIDQFRPDYLERFKPLLSGGLKSLYEHGVVFTNASFQHAITETCPGHATIVTGAHPKEHGIVASWWLDRDSKDIRYCVEDGTHRRAPSTLLRSTLADWLKASDEHSRAFSVAGKDRSAILLGGHSAQGAIWFEPEQGAFASSSYYQAIDEKWLSALNTAVSARNYFGSSWTAHPSIEKAGRLDRFGLVAPDYGDFHSGFPRSLGGLSLAPSEDFFSDIASSPILDELTVDAALFTLKQHNLGEGSSTDYLAIGISGHDRIGHAFGPDSVEILDSVLRIDSSLAKLFHYLDSNLGRGRYLIVVTADHGIKSLPEVKRLKGQSVRRLSADDYSCVQNAGERIAEAFQRSPLFIAKYYLAQEAAQSIPRAELDKHVQEELSRCDFVARVLSSAQIESASQDQLSTDKDLAYYYNSHLPSRSQDYYLLLKESVIDAPDQRTGHGTISAEDRAVPVILMGAGLGPKRIEDPFALHDLATTVASLLGISGPDDVSGTDRSALLISPRPAP